MPSINGAEYLVILVVALLVFGPHRLPELTHKLGTWMREIRKVAQDFRVALEAEVGDLSEPLKELKATREGIEKPLRDVVSGPPPKAVSAGGPTDASPESAGDAPDEHVRANDEASSAGGGMLEWTGPVHESGPTPDDARADFESLPDAGDEER